MIFLALAFPGKKIAKCSVASLNIFGPNIDLTVNLLVPLAILFWSIIGTLPWNFCITTTNIIHMSQIVTYLELSWNYIYIFVLIVTEILNSLVYKKNHPLLNIKDIYIFNILSPRKMKTMFPTFFCVITFQELKRADKTSLSN